MTQHDPLKSLGRLDLNLLVILHVLLETHSTTKTAERINRTQSAVSISLGRLRDFFNDPLFVRSGPKLTPTDFALQLQHPLSRIIHNASSLAESGVSFDPSTSNRSIILAIPDIAQSITAAIVNRLRQHAPHMTVQMADTSLETTDYSAGIKLLLDGKIDLLVSFYINEVPQGIEVKHLDSQSWSIFARSDHPISQKPSLEEWAAYGHIQIASGPEGRSPITDMMATTQVKRNICLKVSSFLQALHMVADSDLLLTTMRPLATPLARRLLLKEIPLPLDIPPVPFCIMTRSTEYDPLSAWLLEQSLKSID